MKNLNIVSPNGNNYALGDKNKEADSVAEVDTTKIREAEAVSENAEKTQEAMERVERAKRRSEELKRRPDGFEKALQQVLGKNPNDVNNEILSGSINDDLKLIGKTIAKRYAENMGKNIAQTAEKAFIKGYNAAKGYI
jgi:predicted transcriptional regulator